MLDKLIRNIDRHKQDLRKLSDTLWENPETAYNEHLAVAEVASLLESKGFKIRGVYERSDAKVRKQEGMELFSGFIGAEFDTNVPIVENGVKYIVDVANGQKTGFFLDQKYNREAIKKFCKDAVYASSSAVISEYRAL